MTWLQRNAHSLRWYKNGQCVHHHTAFVLHLFNSFSNTVFFSFTSRLSFRFYLGHSFFCCCFHSCAFLVTLTHTYIHTHSVYLDVFVHTKLCTRWFGILKSIWNASVQYLKEINPKIITKGLSVVVVVERKLEERKLFIQCLY